VEQHEAEPPRLEPDLLLLILVDHVVVARGAVGAGLAEGHRLAGHVLELDGDVFQDVAHPGARVLREPPDEPARLAVGAAVLLQARQRGHQAVREPAPQPHRGPVLQLAEVDVEPDDREVGIEVGADVHGPVENAHW
jgi:hypothetical protein